MSQEVDTVISGYSCSQQQKDELARYLAFTCNLNNRITAEEDALYLQGVGAHQQRLRALQIWLPRCSAEAAG